MNRISSQNKEYVDLANQVLGWILYAKRSLTVRELQHALSVVPDCTDIDEAALTDEESLISACAGIVTIDKESSVIRLIHYTAQEYFERNRNARFIDAPTAISTTCLTYLGFDVFAEFCIDEMALKKRLENYAFAAYAAEYWGCHIKGDRENDPEYQDAIVEKFKSVSRRDALCQIGAYLEPTEGRFEIVMGRSLLHLFAAHGLATLCKCLLDQRFDHNGWYVLRI